MKLNQESVKQDVKKSEYAFNMKQIPDFELMEIHERQAKILNNKFLLNKLPDKGAKLIAKNEAIEFELDLRKKATDDIITCISELKINDPNDSKENDQNKPSDENVHGLNCADKSLSSSCSSLSHDGSNTGTIITASCTIDKFAVSRSSRLDAIPAHERFIPAQCAKTKTGPPCIKTKSSKEYREKDMCAACTPGGKYDVKQVSLTDVVKLKGRETTYIKELEIKEAQDRLSSLEFGASTSIMKSLSNTPMNYRNRNDHNSDEEISEEEEVECLDEDEQDRKGTISYTVHE